MRKFLQLKGSTKMALLNYNCGVLGNHLIIRYGPLQTWRVTPRALA